MTESFELWCSLPRNRRLELQGWSQERPVRCPQLRIVKATLCQCVAPFLGWSGCGGLSRMPGNWHVRF
jgi:hypothetical protein